MWHRGFRNPCCLYAGSIPCPGRWVKDPTLLQLQLWLEFDPWPWELPYDMGAVAPKVSNQLAFFFFLVFPFAFFFFFFFFFFFLLCRATLAAYGNSKARGLGVEFCSYNFEPTSQQNPSHICDLQCSSHP